MPSVKKPDYMALLEARAAGKATRTVKRTICLQPELLDELQRAQAAMSLTRPMGRYADDRDTAKERYEALKAQVAELSVVAVFQVPTPEEQAVYQRETSDASDEGFVTVARKALVACYRSLLDPEGAPLEYSREQFSQLVQTMWSGELMGAFGAIMSASNGEPDFS